MRFFDTATLTLILSAVAILLFVLRLLWSRRKLYALSYKLPGPVGVPIFGNAFDVKVLTEHHQLYQQITNLKAKYGEVYRLWMGPELHVILSEPNDMECVLRSKETSNKADQYNVLAEFGGEGLLTISGIKWKTHRSIMNHGFNKSCLKSYQYICNKHSEYLVKNLEPFCGTGPVEIYIYLMRMVADSIIEAPHGIPPQFFDGKHDDILYAQIPLGTLVFEKTIVGTLIVDPFYLKTKQGKVLNKTFTTCINFFRKLIEDHVSNVVAERKKNVVNIPESEREGSNTVNLLIEAMEDGIIAANEIYDEFYNLYFGGVETSVTGLGMFFLMMGMHKRCQDLVYEEIKTLFGEDSTGHISPEDLTKTEYLDMCLKETSRLYSAGPLQVRKVEEDFKLKDRDFVLPSGTVILLAIYTLHRNPKYWNDPDLYIPERFSREENAKRPPFAFLPFSSGNRNCIGQAFGFDMWKLAAIHAIRAYEFRSELKYEDLKLRADISIKSINGYYLSIEKRVK